MTKLNENMPNYSPSIGRVEALNQANQRKPNNKANQPNKPSVKNSVFLLPFVIHSPSKKPLKENQ